MAALSWPVYRGKFIKDPMSVRQGNELLAGLERVAGLTWPVYGGNFIKDPMGIRHGHKLVVGLQRVANLWVAGLRGFTVYKNPIEGRTICLWL